MSHITTPRTRGESLIKAAASTATEINHRITPAEAKAMLDILTKHDGSTLTPDLDYQGRSDVSRLFDKLRFNLGIMAQEV